MTNERIEIIELITQACDCGSRQSKACEIMGISVKTFQRWCQSNDQKDGRIEPSHVPTNKLTDYERRLIISTANGEKYSALSPSKIVPLLADLLRYADKVIVKAPESLRQNIKETAQLLLKNHH